MTPTSRMACGFEGNIAHAGLVLMNSAGMVKGNYQPPPPQVNAASLVTGPPGFLADALSTALLAYLEATVARCLPSPHALSPL